MICKIELEKNTRDDRREADEYRRRDNKDRGKVESTNDGSSRRRRNEWHNSRIDYKRSKY